MEKILAMKILRHEVQTYEDASTKFKFLVGHEVKKALWRSRSIPETPRSTVMGNAFI